MRIHVAEPASPSREHGRYPCFELWRQDDNGQRFLVDRFTTRALAEARLAELTRSLHKQIYWIVIRRGNDPNGPILS